MQQRMNEEKKFKGRKRRTYTVRKHIAQKPTRTKMRNRKVRTGSPASESNKSDGTSNPSTAGRLGDEKVEDEEESPLMRRNSKKERESERESHLGTMTESNKSEKSVNESREEMRREEHDTQSSSQQKRKMSTNEAPGPSKRQKSEINAKKRKESTKKERVLFGKVFDTNLGAEPGMKELKEMVEFQNWMHLFTPPAPSVYEAEVIELYESLCRIDDGTLALTVNGTEFVLTESILANILGVKTDGVRAITGKGSTGFKNVIVKDGMYATKASPSKKELKLEYQQVFEFLNNVLLPRTEECSTMTMAGLVLMEALSMFEPINLSAIMFERMIKVVRKVQGKSDLPYG
ncbi:uncharacterized protein LOC132054940 [Lycium ferocissimum]|uniref:uncharacterized protein LOC132054940 n=1 Tax=Lycium ferocissimum TaxID=112874 RepID=UPI002814D733|nr:uncharacterized protein LOC132054940 [Lycium ferocissimum]